MVFEKKIYEAFSLFISMQNKIPYFGPHLPLGTLSSLPEDFLYICIYKFQGTSSTCTYCHWFMEIHVGTGSYDNDAYDIYYLKKKYNKLVIKSFIAHVNNTEINLM